MMPDEGEVSSELCEEKIDLRDDFSSVSVPYQKSIVEEEDAFCDKPTSSNDSIDQRNIPERICFDSQVLGGQYVKKSVKEIEAFLVDDLKVLFKSLSKAVEEISSQLVQLLVENDALQQESDARNVAIEQLLRIAVKETENELKPVQLS